MIHITAKFKCKDTDGDEHIVLKAACWDTGLNAYHNEYIIEMPGHVIKTKDSVDTGFYPTCYLTAGEMDIELDLETRIDI
jgi:hypothetical protein|tara:strand:- start:230 stop:469 length:240 start_codon:yes stop_codon:yes gene_type:complete